jgi:nucleotide-binding universal stress UspA family protein
VSSTFLVPLDGTSFAELALPTAVALVRERHGHLELVAVHEPRPFAGYPDAPWNAAYRTREKRYVAEKAELLSRRCGKDVGHALRLGDAAVAICDQARSVGADVIVMNSHGRAGADRAWNGSVTDAVIAQTPLPVLVLRHSLDPNQRRALPSAYPKIVVAIDDSMSSTEIFDAVSAIVTRGASEVHLVRVVAPVMEVVDVSLPFGFISDAGADAGTKASVASAARELDDQAALLEETTGCDVVPHVLVGRQPAAEILAFARQVGAQLIALTSGESHGSWPFAKGVAAKVLRGSDVPVLVVRSKAS